MKKRTLSPYQQKLLDPRWQKKRLEILLRDDFACQCCYSNEDTLHVHHLWYERGKDPWDYPDNCLITLCESCHEEEATSREREERLLLRVLLEQHLLSGEINEIACAIGSLHHPKSPDVTGHIIAWAIEHIDVIDRLYFHWLSQKRPQKEKSNGVD